MSLRAAGLRQVAQAVRVDAYAVGQDVGQPGVDVQSVVGGLAVHRLLQAVAARRQWFNGSNPRTRRLLRATLYS